MTEVEGSDLENAEKMSKEGIDPSVVDYGVDVEQSADAAEEDRVQRAAASSTDVPELGDQGPITDVAPPDDQIHPEYDELPEPPPIA